MKIFRYIKLAKKIIKLAAEHGNDYSFGALARMEVNKFNNNID